MNYYNEIDRGATNALRAYIECGLIAPGIVDERSICDVQGSDLDGFTQCHFFAGIGGWSVALRMAGWPDDRPVWTGSCPCPPFSTAGKKKECPNCKAREAIPHPYETGIFACCVCGHEWYADERHLWPEFRRLIQERKPSKVFGEQVASADGRIWFAGVRATLEALGYATWEADLCSASVNAPNIRQRLFWVADAETTERGCVSDGEEYRPHAQTGGCGETRRLDVPVQDGRENAADEVRPGGISTGISGVVDGLGNAASNGPDTRGAEPGGQECIAATGVSGGMGDTGGEGLQGHAGHGDDGDQPGRFTEKENGHVAEAGFWDRFALVYCADGKTDGKYRRFEPGTFPLAYGLPRRVRPMRPWLERMGLLAGDHETLLSNLSKSMARAKRFRIEQLKGYGNAINPHIAAEFVTAAEKGEE